MEGAAADSAEQEGFFAGDYNGWMGVAGAAAGHVGDEPRHHEGQPQPQPGVGGGTQDETGQEGLFHTFNPSGAHWSLNDYAWDWRGNCVVSRNSVVEATAARTGAVSGVIRQQQQDAVADPKQDSQRDRGAPPPLSLWPSGLGKGPMGTGLANTSDIPYADQHTIREAFVSSESSNDRDDKLKVDVREANAHFQRGNVARTSVRKNQHNSPEGEVRKSGEKASALKRDESGGAKERADGASPVRMCPVQDCSEQCVPSSKKRIERILCAHHSQQTGGVLVDGQLWRFCQVCYVLHPVVAFRGTNKTCDAVLERKKLMRWHSTHGGAGGGEGGAAATASGATSHATAAAAETSPREQETHRGPCACSSELGAPPLAPETLRETAKKRSRSAVSEDTVHNPARSLEKEKEVEEREGERSVFWSAFKRTVGAGAPAKSKTVPGTQPADEGRVWARGTGAGGAGGAAWAGGGHAAAPAGGGGWGHSVLAGANASELPVLSSMHVFTESDVSLVRAMEEGSLSSLVVPSAAIKVPHAVPEDLLAGGGGGARGGGDGPCPGGGMLELLRWMECGVPADMGLPSAARLGPPLSALPYDVPFNQNWGAHIAEMADRRHSHSSGRGGGEWPAHEGSTVERANRPIHAHAHDVFEQTMALSVSEFEFVDGRLTELGPGYAPGPAPGHPGVMIPEEDLGFDMFIRPGSLIFGVHAQGAVLSPTESERHVAGGNATARDARACADGGGAEEFHASCRHTAASLLASCVNGDSVESKLLRCATSALHAGFNSSNSCYSSRDERAGPADSQTTTPTYDATGDGLYTVPEGVFGSFNGDISRLEIGPDGVPFTVQIQGLPRGFPAGLLDVTSSMVDSSGKTATVRLPWTFQANTTVVCMFRGAHLPLRIRSVELGTTALEISFAPEGGYEVPAAWTLGGGAGLKGPTAKSSNSYAGGGNAPPSAASGYAASAGDGRRGRNGEQHKSKIPEEPSATPAGAGDGAGAGAGAGAEAGAFNGSLEGTATLEVLIADGPMRGLPVGAAIPLLLTPDSELLKELVSAMVPLQVMMNHPRGMLEKRGSRKPEKGDKDGVEFEEFAVLPPPVALLSMLGAVLASHNRGQRANPRMWRGVVAMTRYFNLRHTAGRLGMDSIPPHRSGVTFAAMMVFNAFTNVLAALWSLHTVGVVLLLSWLVFKHVFPMIDWEGAASLKAILAFVFAALLPMTIFFATWRYQSKQLRLQRERGLAGDSSARGALRRRWSSVHAEHAVTAQSIGARFAPFLALAVIVAHFKRLYKVPPGAYEMAASASSTGGVHGDGGERGLGEHEMSAGYILYMIVAEVTPAAMVVVAFSTFLPPAIRLRQWHDVSLAVHGMRAAACVIRIHHNYYLRSQLVNGMLINIVSALTGVLMFPMWSSTQVLAVHVALVVCDWVGHYLHAGTLPAYLIPVLGAVPGEQDRMTGEDAWMLVAMEIVWRILMPTAVNSFAMHRLFRRSPIRKRKEGFEPKFKHE